MTDATDADTTASEPAPGSHAAHIAPGTAPVTLITGASSGIGAAVARRLLAAGHRVAATGRDAGRLAAFAASLRNPAELLTLPGDASDNTAVEAAVADTVKAFGRLDHAIANAGFSDFGGILDADPERVRDMVLANVLGPMLLARAALPALRDSRGRIVLVGSVAGFRNAPGSLYGATKWAVTGLAENIRLAVTADGVGVTLIAPGRVETAFWDAGGGVPGPALTADQVADSVVWALTQPAGVDVNTVVVRPTGQPT